MHGRCITIFLSPPGSNYLINVLGIAVFSFSLATRRIVARHHRILYPRPSVATMSELKLNQQSQLPQSSSNSLFRPSKFPLCNGINCLGRWNGTAGMCERAFMPLHISLNVHGGPLSALPFSDLALVVFQASYMHASLEGSNPPAPKVLSCRLWSPNNSRATLSKYIAIKPPSYNVTPHLTLALIWIHGMDEG